MILKGYILDLYRFIKVEANTAQVLWRKPLWKLPKISKKKRGEV